MQCNNCKTSNLDVIHGRTFCVDCGRRAAQRLGSFSSPITPRQDRSENLLDLSKRVEPARPQTSPEPQPTPQPMPEPERQAEPEPEPMPAPPEPTPGPEPQPTPAAPPPQTQIQPFARTIDTTPQVKTGMAGYTTGSNEVSEASEMTAGQPAVTKMQPHQTYALKDEPAQEPKQPASGLAGTDVQQAESDDHELPFVPDQELQAVNTRNRPTKRRWWQALGFGRSQAWRVAAVSLSIVVLGGYITYLNYPDLAVRVAASRADVHASLPDYVPDGYRFSGPISYGAGELTFALRSSNDAALHISQQRTEWDSQSLLDNYVRYETSQYETYRENGLTIYTFGDREAVWVDDGTLYQIESSDQLNETELVQVAASI